MDKNYVLEIINVPNQKESISIPMEKIMPYIPEGIPMSQVGLYIRDALKCYSERIDEFE